jgi:hypothetical protein
MPTSLSTNLITGGASFLLTLMVLSYLIGDNPLFRIAIYLFIGVSAGYAAAVAWYDVLYPHLVLPLLTGSLLDRLLLGLIPLILCLLMLLKLFPGTTRMGTLPLALLVGIGAAVAVGGAVMGTIFPQTQATMNLFQLSQLGGNWLGQLWNALVMLVGTISTLAYFHFGAHPTATGPKRNRAVEAISRVGQVFIAVTFGVLFAGAFTAAMTALIERVGALSTFILSMLR